MFLEAKVWKAKNKPINVPNKCPFKEEILLEAEKERERIEFEKCERKKAAKQKHPDVTRVGAKRKCISDNLETVALKINKQVGFKHILVFIQYQETELWSR